MMTYLSPYVQSMWMKFNSDLPARSEVLNIGETSSVRFRLKSDGITIDEKSIPDDFVDDLRDDVEHRYVKAAEMIVPLASRIRSAYCEIETSNCQKLQEYLKWTANEDVFLNALQSMEGRVKANLILRTTVVVHYSSVAVAVLRCTAELERALGNVFKLSDQRVSVPRLTKDLLASEILTSVFGSSIMSLLKVLMGSPLSLNSRNVVWHGFAAPHEIPQSFVYVIVAVTATLGRILDEKGFSSDSIPRRPLVKIETITERLRGIFPDFPSDFGMVRSVLESSSFVPQIMLPYWTDALTLMEERRFGETLVLVLPQLEHSLRCLYVKLNDCRERLQTAQSVELYTTLDEILGMKMPNGAPNALISFLGEKAIVALNDLFFYPDGPRLRDRLGHGEIRVEEIDWTLTNHVFSIILYLAIRIVDDDETPLIMTEVGAIREAFHNYRAVYHPFGLVTSLIAETHSSIVSWMSHISQSDLDELERRSGDKVSALRAALVRNYCYADDDLKNIIQIVLKDCRTEADALSLLGWAKSRKYSVLDRPPIELEILRSMRRTLDTIMDIARHVNVTLDEWRRMFDDHRLRSRQRDTYHRIKTSVPTVNVVLRFVLVLFCICIGNFNRVQSLDSDDILALKRFLIRIGRYAESVKSTTSPDRNRWEQSERLSLTFIDYLLKRYVIERQTRFF